MRHSKTDLDTLTRTIYSEARGEYAKHGEKAFAAIAHVICNRLKVQRRYGHTIHEICRKPYQFSCWNSFDPNLNVIESMQLDEGNLTFIKCHEVAKAVLEGDLADPTFGANHYYAKWLKWPPKWARGRKPTTAIGQHLYFKL